MPLAVVDTSRIEPVDVRLGSCVGRLIAKMRRTARRWPVLPENAPVAVGISGGQDSLALLYLLVELNRRGPGKRRLLGIHVGLDAHGHAPPLPRKTESWCRDLGVSVREAQPRLVGTDTVPLSCYRCARIRRRALVEATESLGCSHLAIGHHADDVVETWLVSLFYTGMAESLAPVRSYFGDTVTLVRPLYELRRGEIGRLVRLARLPVVESQCVREDTARRKRIAEVLRALGPDQRVVRRHLYWAAVRNIEGGEE
jgi:tRNA 2-thiocytidine biosynthesis protein TtcA